MKLFSSLPIGKDLVDTFETPFGIIKFTISKNSDLLFEDLRSGWSFCFGTKDILTQHRIIREEKEKVIKYFSENLDFMTTALTLVDVILMHKRPSVANILGYKRFDPTLTGPDVEVTWYPIEPKDRKIDRFYISLL